MHVRRWLTCGGPRSVGADDPDDPRYLEVLRISHEFLAQLRAGNRLSEKQEQAFIAKWLAMVPERDVMAPGSTWGRLREFLAEVPEPLQRELIDQYACMSDHERYDVHYAPGRVRGWWVVLMERREARRPERPLAARERAKAGRASSGAPADAGGARGR